MALIFPNIVRFSIVGGLQNELCVNVFDVRVTTNVGSTMSRQEAIPVIAGDLLNQWSDHILPAVSWAYQAEEVRWVDLDSASGSTGSVTSTDGSTWPEVGGQQVATLPNMVYAKVKKVLEGSNRQQRAGVLRLGGIPENATEANSPNQLTAAYRTDLNGRFEDLKDGINGALNYTANLGVLHTINRQATGFSEISQYSVQGTVGTIRRRMPGYGD